MGAMRRRSVPVAAEVYRQFDADYALDVPAEGYGGWRKATIDLDLSRTALVSMHAWDNFTREEYPGWYRCVEYMPRATRILETVFPPLLADVRAAGMSLFHVVDPVLYGKMEKRGRTHAPKPARPCKPPWMAKDPLTRRFHALRAKECFVGAHNWPDVRRSFKAVDFHPASRPAPGEPVVRDTGQLDALCRRRGIVHLVYIGFAINVCLFRMPGGMWDMNRRGYFCSTIREATTAVENRESARAERNKEAALWQVGLEFGFVFRVGALRKALRRLQEMRA